MSRDWIVGNVKLQVHDGALIDVLTWIRWAGRT